MARTIRHLWPKIVSWDHLLASYYRCRRRKRYKIPALRFHHLWESNLRVLRSELCNETWKPGQYYNFQITDPKPRLISAAPFRDRIVHHALVGVLEPIFEQRFIFDSYACRKAKGTHRAIKRAQYYLRRHRYYLKTDIVKFFPSVDHVLMCDTLQRVIRDDKVMQLVALILESGNQISTSPSGPSWFPGDDLFAALRPKGLPIGNLTSQFFANVFLDPIDHFAKEELRVPGYVRYADDLLLFGDTKEQLWEWRDRLSQRLERCRLALHGNKTVVSKSDSGVKYLGFRVFPHGRRATQEAILRFNRRRRKWIWDVEHGQLTLPELRPSMSASLAHLSHCNSVGIRRALMRRVRIKIRRSTK